MDSRGYIVIWRKFQETSFYKDSYAVHLAIHLLQKANHENAGIIFNGEPLTVNRGQMITGRQALARETGIAPSTIRNKLELLKNVDFLKIDSNSKFSVITIIKYDDYQIPKNKTGQREDSGILSTRTASGKALLTKTLKTGQQTGQPKSDDKVKKQDSKQDSQRTAGGQPEDTNNNVKNDNNDKKIRDKELFLEFVLLTNDEHKKLLEKFGDQGTKDRIEKLNNYIGSKGDKYKSHYHTILTWDNRDKQRPVINASPQKVSAPNNLSSDVDKLLQEKLSKIATKDMIKDVLRVVPEDLWWKVNKFLQKQHPGGGNGFVEAEKEIGREILENRAKFNELVKGVAESK